MLPKSKSLFFRGKQKFRNQKHGKYLGANSMTRLWIEAEHIRRDKRNTLAMRKGKTQTIYTREGNTGGNNHGSGETSDQ